MQTPTTSFARRVVQKTAAVATTLFLGACLVTDDDVEGSKPGPLDGAWLYVSERQVVIDPASGDTLNMGIEMTFDTNSVLWQRLAVIGDGTLTEIWPSSERGSFNTFSAANDSQWVVTNWTRNDTLLVHRNGDALTWAQRYEREWNEGDSTWMVGVWVRTHLVAYDGPVPPTLWATAPASVGNEPDNDSAHATTIALDGAIHYAYLTEGDKDWYRIAVDSGAMVSVLTQGPLSTYLSLYDAEGTLVVENDNVPWAFGRNAGIDHAFESAGTYYAVVEGYSGNETGYYSITVTPVDSVRSEENGG